MEKKSQPCSSTVSLTLLKQTGSELQSIYRSLDERDTGKRDRVKLPKLDRFIYFYLSAVLWKVLVGKVDFFIPLATATEVSTFSPSIKG